MFRLTEDDLHKTILGCGDGPASFNAELTELGGRCVSVDPIYQFTAEQIRTRIHTTFPDAILQTDKNKHEFTWESISSIKALAQIRLDAMKRFLSDYETARTNERYFPQSVTGLSFSDKTFDLALSSHFLFLYSDHLDLSFHIEAITEMCRVASEIRIFPLLQMGTRPSPHVQPVQNHFQSEGYKVDQVRVSYEFQRGGNQMLVIKEGK